MDQSDTQSQLSLSCKASYVALAALNVSSVILAILVVLVTLSYKRELSVLNDHAQSMKNLRWWDVEKEVLIYENLEKNPEVSKKVLQIIIQGR